MSEQPNQPIYELRSEGTLFEDDNVIDLGMAREGMKAVAEVQALREAREFAYAKPHQSLDQTGTEKPLTEVSTKLSILTRIRRELTEAA